MNINQKDIERYLSEVKEAVEKDNYRLERNAIRQDNINMFLDYVIDEGLFFRSTNRSIRLHIISDNQEANRR